MDLKKVYAAQDRISVVAKKTPLDYSHRLSDVFGANISLKREDLQVVRSYKIRGAYNKIAQLTKPQKFYGVVCASAGNHAQGVALACEKLKIKGVVFMPVTTPKQKVSQVELFGKDFCEVRLIGDSFDDAQKEANAYCDKNKATFIHPFDDLDVIAGQGTVGLEILEDEQSEIDYLFVPVGGGGLASGVAIVFNKLSPKTKIIGVEPKGAPSMQSAFKAGGAVELEKIDKFIDGASVKKVGERNFEICKEHLHDIISVPEGQICSTILSLYNNDGIVVEPAGALAIGALHACQEQIRGKSVVCVVSGGNNDVSRTEEIRERALLYEGRKHYFLIEFPQRPGALKEFVSDVLGTNDDITHFQFSKKNSREKGPAVVGLELNSQEALELVVNRMNEKKFEHTYLNNNSLLFSQLVG